MMTVSRERCQAKVTWLGVTPYVWAMSPMTGSARTVPKPVTGFSRIQTSTVNKLTARGECRESNAFLGAIVSQSILCQVWVQSG